MVDHCRLLALPEEVLEHVVAFVPDVESILRIERVSRTFSRLVNSPLQWRDRCRRFRFWEQRHDYERKLAYPRPAEVDWRKLFLERLYVEKRSTELLNEIIASPVDRIRRFNEISNFGYDAKDCLAQHENCPDDTEDVLARRWHAKAAIHHIHRRRGMQIWKQLASGEDDISLETALGCFDLFVLRTAGGDIEDTSALLDNLSYRFHGQTPDFPQLSVKEKAMALSTFMYREGFRGAPPERYRALKNSYIGISLRTDRITLPLTSVAIYCSLAKRVGLRAHPCSFPHHVIAIVEEGTKYIYLDPFRNEDIARETLENRLQVMGVGKEAMTPYLSPTPAAEIVLRTSRNIIESIRHTNSTAQPVDRNCALYAALMASVILGSGVRMNLLQPMIRQLQDEFAMDVFFFEQDLVPKIEDLSNREILQDVCAALRAEDSSPRTVNRRESTKDQAVKYRIGTLFKHKRYSYSGVIFGWTRICSPLEGEDWIQQNQVDELPHGRHQPFYHVLVTDDSVRYIAEENIQQIRPRKEVETFKLAGKYFKRFCREKGVFVSNIGEEYPDD